MKKSAEDKFKNLCDCVQHLKDKTYNDYVLSSKVLKKEGIPINDYYRISGDNTLLVFIKAGLFEVNTKMPSYKGSKYIKWIGGNDPVEKIANHLIKIRNEYVRERNEKKRIKKLSATESITNVVEKLSTNAPKSFEISIEEYKKNHYGGSNSSTILTIYDMFVEIYKQRKTATSRSSRSSIMVDVVINGVLKKINVADMSKERGGRKNSYISPVNLRNFGIFDEFNQWVESQLPTMKMAADFHLYVSYNIFLKKICREAQKNTITEEKSNINDEPKRTNFPSSVALSKSEVIKPESFYGLSLDEKLNCLYELVFDSEMHRRELEEQKSKNEYKMLLLLEQKIGGI